MRKVWYHLLLLAKLTSLIDLSAGPKVTVPIRERFEDFSTDHQIVSSLKSLYNATDDVDLGVGLHLDEEMFPGTTIPKSALIISLFSLFGTANSDRFCIGFALMRCLLIDKPWNCKPSNALEDLLWKPYPLPGLPNTRWIDPFWATELDLQTHGTNLLWRLVTENTAIQCIQRNPLFPADPVSNPVQCELPPHNTRLVQSFIPVIQVIIAILNAHATPINLIVALGLVGGVVLLSLRVQFPAKGGIPVMTNWPLLGAALAYQRDPRKLLLRSFAKVRGASSTFGLKLGKSTHYVLTQMPDLRQFQRNIDNETKFSLKSFMKSINFPIIIGQKNFESNIQALLIRTHLTNPKTLQSLLSRSIKLRKCSSLGFHSMKRARMASMII